MTECGSCDALFQPDEDGQELCDSCRDDDGKPDDASAAGQRSVDDALRERRGERLSLLRGAGSTFGARRPMKSSTMLCRGCARKSPPSLLA
jgi:hypothetical protein